MDRSPWRPERRPCQSLYGAPDRRAVLPRKGAQKENAPRPVKAFSHPVGWEGTAPGNVGSVAIWVKNLGPDPSLIFPRSGCMSMEHAFLRALETSRSTALAPKVRKAIRHSHKAQPDLSSRTDRASVWVADQAAAYQWRKLGKRWASLRIGGCSWVGPIDALRAEWREMLATGPEKRPAAMTALLESFAEGLGVAGGYLDARSREFLLHAAASRPEYSGGQARLDGHRWFSPATLLVEAVLDLSGGDSEQYKALRTMLAYRRVRELDGQASTDALHQLCGTVGEWLLGG